MEDIKAIIAENIAALRKSYPMTQIELAERLNYSDKAISKWERGESVPDISVLKAIADLFGVTVDYLITSGHDGEILRTDEEKKAAEAARLRKRRLRGMVTGMSVLLVCLVSLVVFITLDVACGDPKWHWLAFIYALPVSCVVWLVLNSIWFSRRKNYPIISLLVWSALLSIHLTTLAFGYNLWQVYLLGIPGQLIIILWSVIGKKI
jgi:transcriptional regulator with XRE-family HTH domain